MEGDRDVRFLRVMKTILRMIRLGMPKWLLCLTGVTLAGLGSYVISLLFGLVMSVTMRHFEAGTSAVPNLLLLLVMLGAFIPLVVLGYHFNLRGGLGIRASIQKKLLSAWLRQTEDFASRRHSGEAMALLTSDMQIMENFYFQGLMQTFFIPLVEGIAAVLTIGFVNVWLSVIPMFFGLCALGTAVLTGKRIHKRNQRLRKAIDAAVSRFSDLAGGNAAHRYWGTVGSQLDDYEAVSDSLAKDGVSAKNLDVHVRSAGAMLSAISLVAFFTAGIALIQSGQIAFSSLLLTFPLQSMVFEMVNCLGNTWRFLITSSVSGDRVLDALSAPQEEDASGECPEETGDSLVFADVVFGYRPKDDLLNGVSFTVRRGEKVALVGASGCGKTTVFKLLLKFYEPESGAIKLHGIDSRACTPNAWRSKLIYLEQSAPLLHRTVRENIAMGRYGDGVTPSEESVVRAARAAGAHEFITALPQGYDTLVDEGCENLSGGQRQRIAIARAFLAGADLLLLDEPTAALDTESQRVVWESLQKLMKTKTALIISHNLESLKSCDRILVMENGQIQESGTHEELLAAGGRYAELYRNQFR
jgi:ABC-type multidrug transport system fused ATPase/permease subunit